MAWERRGARRYFYASERVGDRVVKRYLGRGPAGEMAALQAEEAAVDRRREVDALRALRRALAPAESLLADLDRAADAALAAAMDAAGYRQEHGEWRRRRDRPIPEDAAGGGPDRGERGRGGA